MTAFAGRIDEIGDLRRATVRNRLRVLSLIREIAGDIDRSACNAPADRYGRRVLAEDPSGWVLAAIALRHGQETEPHDHAGWGCVVTIEGIERDRRFRLTDAGELALIAERDYAAGGGYVFDANDIHQPIGADSHRVTIALHFLVHGDEGAQAHHEHRRGA
ncbi:MAG: hypothetical protein IT336_16275 [Thermomicrobiales bacterium]|nr:hypothetical protein [Thermomicrobiales bacterium]